MNKSQKKEVWAVAGELAKKYNKSSFSGGLCYNIAKLYVLNGHKESYKTFLEKFYDALDRTAKENPKNSIYSVWSRLCSNNSNTRYDAYVEVVTPKGAEALSENFPEISWGIFASEIEGGLRRFLEA